MTLLVTNHGRLWKVWAANFLLAESILSLLFGIGFAAWAWSGGWLLLSATFDGMWSAFFSTLVTLFGALFGFVITAASIAVALVTEEKMRLFVEGKRYLQLWDTFLLTISALGFALAVSLAGLILVRNPYAHVPILSLLFFLGTLASLGLMRTVWLLNSLPRLHAALVRQDGPRSG